jgi:hypothetical protein
MTDDSAILERFRIHELIGRYVDALNHRDWKRYEACWIEDSVFAMTIATDDAPPVDKMTTIKKPISVRVVGRKEILRLVETYNNYPWMFQMPHAIVVDLHGATTAQVRHTLYAYSQSLTLIGMCYDRAVKGSDGAWRLAARDFRPSYFESAEAPGQTIRHLPDPSYLNLPLG